MSDHHIAPGWVMILPVILTLTFLKLLAMVEVKATLDPEALANYSKILCKCVNFIPNSICQLSQMKLISELSLKMS